MTVLKQGADEDVCPKCGASWRTAQIPVEYMEAGHYGHREPCKKKREWDTDWDPTVPCTCPPQFYSRLIGIETANYDGVSFWRCPDCGTQWDRFTGMEVV